MYLIYLSISDVDTIILNYPLTSPFYKNFRGISPSLLLLIIIIYLTLYVGTPLMSCFSSLHLSSTPNGKLNSLQRIR